MKRTKLNRRGKSSHSKLKAKAWSIFSRWIRERDKYTCITCDKKGKGTFMHAGHYISRKCGATMFDERNVHAQCMNCNMWGYGNMGTYTLKLQDMYGPGIIKELTDKSKDKNFQMTDELLEEVIKKYDIYK